MPKEPGDRVGRYIIDRRLGAGGMAEAYLAHQDGMAGFKKQIVVKVLHGWHASDPATVELFLREARVGGRLSHANIVQIFDVGEHEGQPYIAMEYVQGLTLQQATKRCWAMGAGIPIDVATRIVATAAEGLHHAHTLKNAEGGFGGIIHRDVSPDNIIIARDGTVKVLDFGVARIGGAEATKSGDIKGKIPFMPPEQLDGGIDVDARADLWALGVTLYWCLTARRPFGGANDALVMRAIMDDVPTPVRALNPNVSPEIEAVVMNLLEKDREKRVGSALKLASRLKKLLPPTQENPVAHFIERMRQFDEDPPEKRPEARATGGWPAITRTPDSNDSSASVVLADATSSLEDLVSSERSTGLSEPSSSAFDLVEPREAPRGITGLFGAPRREDGIPAVEDHEMEGMRSTTVNVDPLEATARNDVTLDEDAQLPGLEELSAATVVLPGHAARAEKQRAMVYAAAVVAGVLLAIVVIATVASLRSTAARDEPVPPVGAAPGDAPAVAVGDRADGAEPSDAPEAGGVDPEAAPNDEVRAAPEPRQKQPEATRAVFVVAPQHVRWLSIGGKLLGEGTRSLRVAESDKLIVAHDSHREGRTAVPVAGHIDYNALPRGKLLIKATPYATDVKLGGVRFGPTPLAPIDVVAGTYKVILENNRNVVVRQAKVRAGTETLLSVDVPTK